MVLVPLSGGKDCQNVPEHLGSIYNDQVGVLRFPHFSVLMVQELPCVVSSKMPVIISSANGSI
jgi:hypothetical protein